MFKIKRNPKEESTTLESNAPTETDTDIIKTLNCSTSAKMTLKRNPIRPIYFRAGSDSLSQAEEKHVEMRTNGATNESSSENLPMKERIFSISSTTFPSNKDVITFLATICLYSFCSIFLQVVDAQFSPMTSNQNTQYNNNQKQLPSEVRMMAFGNNQPGMQPGMQSIVTPSGVQARNDAGYVSIDRFDSGEQIRPPLLGMPTTLAPPSKSQQVSAYQQGNFNMEASASDSYLTPEERNQLLRQQENHYEGRDTDKTAYQQGENPTSMSNSKSSNSPNDGSSNADVDNTPEQILENRSLQSEATNNGPNSAANDSDDSDYDQDDEPQQEPKKGAPSRIGSGATVKKQTPNNKIETRRTMHANDNGDESEPNDDFGGVNDDAYFSRQTNGGSGSSGSGLNHGASQQQNRGSAVAKQYDGLSSRMNYNPDTRASEGKTTPIDEGQGFGPGPNEAYLADQAESSGKVGLDNDDDGEASNLNDMDDGKLDRRASNQDTKSNPSTGTNKAAGGSPQQDSFNNDDDSDADEAADSSDDSFASSPTTPEADVNSQSGTKTAPRESTSAVTPAVATAASSIQNVQSNLGSSGSQVNGIKSRGTQMKPTLPLFGLQRLQHQPTAASTQQYMEQASQHQQVTAGSNQQPLSSTGTKHHKSAFNAAYNPQNNPSHIGKFFIN